MLTQRGGATLAGGLAAGAAGWVLSLPELAGAGAGILAVVSVCVLWVWLPFRPVVTMVAEATPSAVPTGGMVSVEVALTLSIFEPPAPANGR